MDKSVHISNAYAREEFRKFSYLSEKAISVILACGTKGYFQRGLHFGAFLFSNFIDFFL